MLQPEGQPEAQGLRWRQAGHLRQGGLQAPQRGGTQLQRLEAVARDSDPLRQARADVPLGRGAPCRGHQECCPLEIAIGRHTLVGFQLKSPTGT